jgi:catechol 2,3-dioxygenase-like lactoylglutathione lyase family enzyme
MTLPVSFDHCVIHVSDWERSTAFYRDVLGAEPIPVGKGLAYRLGLVQLNCHGPDQIGTPRAQLPVMPGGSDLRFEWQGLIEYAIAHLRPSGGRDRAWSGYTAWRTWDWHQRLLSRSGRIAARVHQLG